MAIFLHPTSIVENGSKICNGVKVWHWTHVCAGAIIRENVNIGQGVYVGPNVTIGAGSKIQNNCLIFEGVLIEDDVFCGPAVTFTNVKIPRAFINQKSNLRPTIVKKGASIGANSTVVCGVEIGEYAIIGAGSLITKNVKKFALVLGSPGKQIGWVDIQGNRLDLPLGTENVKELKTEDGVFVLQGAELSFHSI